MCYDEKVMSVNEIIMTTLKAYCHQNRIEWFVVFKMEQEKRKGYEERKNWNFGYVIFVESLNLL